LRPVDKSWKPDDAWRAIYDLREELAEIDSLQWARETFEDLNNLSNCLCEYDKYCRVLHGEGVPRSRYVPKVGLQL
jgi:hypothetical protein